ncbi:putative pentatricopeptide repeat-containing protein At5g08490 isoform X2 [Spinacia oleracea]|uniref:Pentatricopeptide repeat-containing protein At5g08490 isoform X2 n=1 Tax=Spinacia oleracea TaxID=3562 RepID=A0ABM3QGV4_SPIOL|nr:putative pentatricopeptide repeat-containing protein At5g08490 isoform X2 [Spinacia oleracea]
MPDFKAWCELIRAQSISGRHDEVLSLFVSKLRAPFGYKPDHLVLQTVLKSCAILPSLNVGRALHSVVVKLGHLSCLSVSKRLLNVYAKGKAFNDCKKLFDQMPKYDTVVWNIVLAGLAGSRVHDQEVMRLVHSMHTCQETELSPVSIAIILPVCARLRSLNAGKSIHSCAIKSGLASETLVGNSLVSMYAKCGLVHDCAYASFCEINDKDVISWNALIAGFSESGFCNDAYVFFRHMLLGPVAPNYATLASILPVCATLDRDIAHNLGRELHAYALRHSELQKDVFVVNALMSFYLRMGVLEGAEALFAGMTSRDLVSWNVIIAGYASNNVYSKAVHLFHNLVSEKMLKPNSVTLISVLPACGHLQNVQMVKQIHGYIFQFPALYADTAVNNALISSYAKCGDLDSSFRTFRIISQKDLISWNSMLDAFAESGWESRLVNLLHQMFEEDFGPDSITILTLIRFYGSVSRLYKIREVHGYLLRACLCQNTTQPTLGNALLDAYAKCGYMDYARKISGILLSEGRLKWDAAKPGSVSFECVSQNDLMTSNLLIRAYVENNCLEQAVALLSELQVKGVKPDATTIMSILPMCAKMASAHLLRQCHGYMIRARIDDVQLGGTMIDLYSKCGSLSLANKLFWSSSHKDLVMITALIGGYAMHGLGKEALVLFSHMLVLGMKPDHIALTAILSACSHAGLVDEGLKIFHSIEKVYGVKPTMEQYGCVVDLLARRGPMMRWN